MACSIAVFTVIIERTLFWISLERKRNLALMDEVLSLAETGDWGLIKERAAGCRENFDLEQEEAHPILPPEKIVQQANSPREQIPEPVQPKQETPVPVVIEP